MTATALIGMAKGLLTVPYDGLAWSRWQVLASMMALVNGRVPAAALTLDELLQVREGGVDARAILVFDASHGADVVMGHPSVTSLAQLRGRRIGVEDTALGALMLARLLESAGLKAVDVVKVPMTADQHVAAYERGEGLSRSRLELYAPRRRFEPFEPKRGTYGQP